MTERRVPASRLGPRQLELLRNVGTTSALVIASKRSRHLCELGLMKSNFESGNFAHITPDGLRALADAVDAGRIQLFTDPKYKAA